MRWIVLGPPGSGKGTQAKRVAKKLGYFYLSTGQMFRDMKDERPDLVKNYVDKGLLVPNDEVVVCFKEYLLKKDKLLSFYI